MFIYAQGNLLNSSKRKLQETDVNTENVRLYVFIIIISLQGYIEMNLGGEGPYANVGPAADAIRTAESTPIKKPSLPLDESEKLTSSLLLSFFRQIAAGMVTSLFSVFFVETRLFFLSY